MSSHQESPLRSMTGFASVEGEIQTSRMRIEMRSLNHRFLDLKTRLPKKLQVVEPLLRNLIQSRFSRGSVELKIEGTTGSETTLPKYIANEELAQYYLSMMKQLQTRLGIHHEIHLKDVISLPDVITLEDKETTTEPPQDSLWKEIQPLAEKAMNALVESRTGEGATLLISLNKTLETLRDKLSFLRKRRAECQNEYKEKFTQKIQSLFENYPIQEQGVKAVLESRIAQELAIQLDRSDIEEELTRFDSHIGHFKETLKKGSPAGRKLDFILQEISREVNTLGNKAQDFAISHEVVELKVQVEQLREQVMNIE